MQGLECQAKCLHSSLGKGLGQGATQLGSHFSKVLPAAAGKGWRLAARGLGEVEKFGHKKGEDWPRVWKGGGALPRPPGLGPPGAWGPARMAPCSQTSSWRGGRHPRGRASLGWVACTRVSPAPPGPPPPHPPCCPPAHSAPPSRLPLQKGAIWRLNSRLRQARRQVRRFN